MGLACIRIGNDSRKDVTEIHYIRRPNCKRRSGDTQSTAHANMRIHKSTSNPDVNTHRPIGSAILRRHELRRERGLRVAQGYWLSTVLREHRRTVCRTTVMTPTSCEASPQVTLVDTGRGWVSLLRCAWYVHSGEAFAYTCYTKNSSPMQHAIWHIGN